MTGPPDRPQPADEELMHRVAAGDSDALAQLFKRYSGTVYSLAYRMLNDREGAEELLNEAFVRVWRQAPSFDARRGKFSTWLMSVARNLGIDQLRSRRARPQRSDPLNPDDAELDLADESVNVERDVWNAERRRLIRQALQELPAPQREALELAYFEGLTQSEISAKLGDPLGTTKTRIRLGLQKLRDLLLSTDLGAEIS
ncbi:MAG TPA: sigma-70 family RNA polymerase sigma factor [Chloroflexota bacterium]|nr:sigma-70 family RNA polymerase sigma factor [Chloroflexota bacterium]